MRIVFGIALSLGIPLGLGAKTYTFHFPPKGYAEACEKHRELISKGQTVKADRLAKQYRDAYIFPTFFLTSNHKRSLRLINDYGWSASKGIMGADYWLRQIPDHNEGEYSTDPAARKPTFEIGITVPQNNLEKWQDFLLKYFPSLNYGEKWKHNTVIREVIVIANNTDSKARSIASDCFDSSDSTGLIIHGWLSEHVVLQSYKLGTLRRIGTPEEKTKSEDINTNGGKKITPSPDSAEEKTDSDEKQVDTDETAKERTETEEDDEKAETKHAEATIIRPLLFFDDEGDPAPFNRLLQNGPIVLNFTASYCTACEEELKLLKELHAKRKKPEAQLVVVDIDKKEKQELYMNKFRALMGNKPPARTQLLFDPYQKNYQKVNGDGEEKLPLTLLVDQDGRILRRINGFDRAGLEQLYKKLETLR